MCSRAGGGECRPVRILPIGKCAESWDSAVHCVPSGFSVRAPWFDQLHAVPARVHITAGTCSLLPVSSGHVCCREWQRHMRTVSRRAHCFGTWLIRMPPVPCRDIRIRRSCIMPCMRSREVRRWHTHMCLLPCRPLQPLRGTGWDQLMHGMSLGCVRLGSSRDLLALLRWNVLDRDWVCDLRLRQVLPTLQRHLLSMPTWSHACKLWPIQERWVSSPCFLLELRQGFAAS